MADLKTNYKDDVLDTSKNEKRKFRMIQNDDGTVSFEDATEYTQQGDVFGAADINATNAKINEQSQSLTKLNEEIVRYTDYHGFGDNSTFNNVKSGSIIFIRGSGNDYYYLGFVCKARIITMLNNGFTVMPTYDYNSKQLTLMPGAYYYIII